MVISALLTSANLLLAQSAGSSGATEKAGQSLLANAAASNVSSPRMGPDTYTPSVLNSADGSSTDASIQSPYAHKTSGTDALAKAVATAQKDADAAALDAQQNPGGTKAAVGQLARDMATLSSLMQKDSASQSGSGTTADSIVITASGSAGTIAAMASDSANASGSEQISTVAYVGADGQVMASGEGSITASDGTTTAAVAGYDASATSDGSQAAITAYAGVGTQTNSTSAMQWAGVLLNAAAATTTSQYVDGGSNTGSYGSLSAFIASSYLSGYSSTSASSSQGNNVSVYA